jgi:hypothetical protein
LLLVPVILAVNLRVGFSQRASREKRVYSKALFPIHASLLFPVFSGILKESEVSSAVPFQVCFNLFSLFSTSSSQLSQRSQCHSYSSKYRIFITKMLRQMSQSSQQSQPFQHRNVSDKSFVLAFPIIPIVPNRNISNKNAGNAVTIVPTVPIHNCAPGSEITIYNNSCACFCGLENCQPHQKICYTLCGLELACFSVDNLSRSRIKIKANF